MKAATFDMVLGSLAWARALHKTGLVPYCATFTIFTDYMRNAIRLSALADAGTIFVTTQGSTAVGEDGPTHQPIETVPSLCMISNLTVIRPADANETSGAYAIAVERSKLHSTPTLLACIRQACQTCQTRPLKTARKAPIQLLNMLI